MALSLQRVADVRRTPVLPNYEPMDQLDGRPLPYDGRLALVGDANRGQLLRNDQHLIERAPQS